jgi:hypothetical protein
MPHSQGSCCLSPAAWYMIVCIRTDLLSGAVGEGSGVVRQPSTFQGMTFRAIDLISIVEL